MADEKTLLGDERYMLHHVREVAKTLTDLAQQQVLLNITFDASSDLYPTTIIAVDEKNKALYLDISLDAEINTRLLASKHLVIAKDSGLQVKWRSQKAVAINFRDGRAIKLELPTAMLRLQRRDYYRLTTPVMHTVYCQIVLAATNPTANNLEDDNILELSLTDVGLGGVGATIAAGSESALVQGRRFERCKISFPDIGVISVTLEVRYEVLVKLQDGSIGQRVGLQYVDLSKEDQDLIQRYVRSVERAKSELA